MSIKNGIIEKLGIDLDIDDWDLDNMEEIERVLAWYKSYYKKHYSLEEIYQIIADWLANQDLEFISQVMLQRNKAFRRIQELHFEKYGDRYFTKFDSSMLKAENVFCIPNKVHQSTYIKTQLKKLGIKSTGKLTAQSTHAIWDSKMPFTNELIYLKDSQKLLKHLNQNTTVEASPFDQEQKEKLIRLLFSKNRDSIDLALNILKKLESIDKDLLVPIIIGTYIKGIYKSKFKAGTKNIVGKAVEQHIPPKEGIDYGKEFTQPKNFYLLLDTLIENKLDPTPLFDLIVNQYGDHKTEGLTNIVRGKGDYQPCRFFNGSRMERVKESYIPYLLNYPERLQKIEVLQHFDSPMAEAPFIQLLQALPKLKIIKNSNFEAPASIWKHAPKLEKMSLGNGVFIGDYTETKTSLIELRINPENQDDTDALMASLGKIHSLEKLDILISDTFLGIINWKALNNSLRQMPNLEHLSIRATELPNKELIHFFRRHQVTFRKTEITIDEKALLDGTSIKNFKFEIIRSA